MEDAVKAMQSGDVVAAEKELQVLAKERDPRAQYFLGFYIYGNPDSKLFYIGDSIDDALSARAAHIPFIGIAAPSNPRYVDLAFLFQQERAYAIVDDINYLNEVFPA